MKNHNRRVSTELENNGETEKNMLGGPVETFGKQNLADQLSPTNVFSEPPLEAIFFSILRSLWKHTGVRRRVSTGSTMHCGTYRLT